MRGLLLVVAACGSSSPRGAPPPVVGNEVPKPKVVDPHASIDAMVRATFARMAANDLDGLMELADPKEQLARGIDCPPDAQIFDADKERERTRKKLATAAAAVSGMTLEVVAIERGNGDVPANMQAGQMIGKCTIKVDIHTMAVQVKLRASAHGKPPEEQDVRVKLVEVGDRWYLERAPRLRGPEDAYLAKYEEHTQRVCSCTDLACAKAADADFAAWSTAWTTAHPDVDPMQSPRGMEITKMLVSCRTKLAQPPTP